MSYLVILPANIQKKIHSAKLLCQKSQKTFLSTQNPTSNIKTHCVSRFIFHKTSNDITTYNYFLRKQLLYNY